MPPRPTRPRSNPARNVNNVNARPGRSFARKTTRSRAADTSTNTQSKKRSVQEESAEESVEEEKEEEEQQQQLPQEQDDSNDGDFSPVKVAKPASPKKPSKRARGNPKRRVEPEVAPVGRASRSKAAAGGGQDEDEDEDQDEEEESEPIQSKRKGKSKAASRGKGKEKEKRGAPVEDDEDELDSDDEMDSTPEPSGKPFKVFQNQSEQGSDGDEAEEEEQEVRKDTLFTKPKRGGGRRPLKFWVFPEYVNNLRIWSGAENEHRESEREAFVAMIEVSTSRLLSRKNAATDLSLDGILASQDHGGEVLPEETSKKGADYVVLPPLISDLAGYEKTILNKARKSSLVLPLHSSIRKLTHSCCSSRNPCYPRWAEFPSSTGRVTKFRLLTDFLL